MNKTRRHLIVALNVAVFWMVLPAGLFGLGRWVDLGVGFDRWTGAWRWAPGVLLALAGSWICAHASVLLKTRGNGLPISALPPTRYVTQGPYRVFRHPIYAGYFYMMEGLALLVGSPGMALAAVPAFTFVWFNTWVGLYEEPLLLERFGADFRAHSRKTAVLLPVPFSRWLRRAVLYLVSIRFPHTVEGRHHLPARGPFIFVTNHASYLDFFFGNSVMPGRITIPVTAEVFRRPVQRAFMRFMGAIPKRRFGRDPDAAQALDDELRAGGIVGIAVEGERSWTGELGWPAPGVAAFLARAHCPIVPVVFSDAYRLWPRWASAPAGRRKVTAIVGEPFRLDNVPFEQVDHVVRESLAALLPPDQASVRICDYPDARPQLVLWRCPVCRNEECLSLQGTALTCSRCQAAWDCAQEDLVLVAPADRAGETGTIGHWARLAGADPAIPPGDGPVLQAEQVELRQDAQGLSTLRPLLSRGKGGKATLFAGRLEWAGKDNLQTIKLERVRTVTTERNNTLQLGVGDGVVQLVFQTASPLRWQIYVEQLCKMIPKTDSSPSTPTSTPPSVPERGAS